MQTYEQLQKAYDCLMHPDTGLYVRRKHYEDEKVAFDLRRTALLQLQYANHSTTHSSQTQSDTWKNVEANNKEGHKLDAYAEYLSRAIPAGEELLYLQIPTTATLFQSLAGSFEHQARKQEIDRYTHFLKGAQRSKVNLQIDGQLQEVAVQDVMLNLIEGTDAIKHVLKVTRISSPPFNVTRDLPKDDTDILPGNYPIVPLRKAIIESLLLYTKQLLDEAADLFLAIKTFNKEKGTQSLVLELLPPNIPVDPFIPWNEVLKWNQSLPNTPQSTLQGDVHTYRQGLLAESGKSEQTMSEDELSMLNALCANFEANMQSVRQGHKLGTMEIVRETNFSAPPKLPPSN